MVGDSGVATRTGITPAMATPDPQRPGAPPARTVRFEVSSATIVTLVVVGASLWLLVRLAPILLVLVVSLLIVGTLSPSVRWLETRGVGRRWGIAIVFLTVLIATLLVVTLTIPSLASQAVAMFEREPAARAAVADRLGRYRISAPLATWLRSVAYDSPTSTVPARALAYSVQILELLAYGISAIFLAFYMMIDRDRLRGGLFAVIPRTHHIRLSRVMMNLETIVGAYIRGQMITSLLMASATFVLLTACGVENALALAVFAGVADVLPYVGGLLAVVPAFAAALRVGPTTAVVVVAVMFAYQEFESRVLVPRIYGRGLRLPSSIVIFALLAGGALMGIVGALLALPVAATVMMLLEELRVELPGEQAQPADTDQRVRDDLGEEEYERRTEGVGAEAAAAIAVEISVDRKAEECRPPDPALPVSTS